MNFISEIFIEISHCSNLGFGGSIWLLIFGRVMVKTADVKMKLIYQLFLALKGYRHLTPIDVFVFMKYMDAKQSGITAMQFEFELCYSAL